MTKQEMENRIEQLLGEIKFIQKKIEEKTAEEKCEHDWDEAKIVKNRFGKESELYARIFAMYFFENPIIFQRKCKKCGKVETTSKYEIKYEPKWGE